MLGAIYKVLKTNLTYPYLFAFDFK